METCAQCGHQLGVGRFCINCGLPVDPVEPVEPVDRSWGTDTAERPAVLDPAGPTVAAPRTPPPVLEPPQQPRFPLYADQVGRPGPLPSGPPPPLPPLAGHHRDPRRRPAWLPWALVALALLLTAGLGGILLLTGGDDETDLEPATASSRSSTPSSEAPSPTPTPTPTETPSPTDTPTDTPTESPAAPGRPENVARFATATVPGTAPPNQDVDGNQVRYEARNLLDDVRTTCWRTPGDASGQTITLTLDGPTTLSRVGLVNGYAKTSEADPGRLNWYRGNRRVLAVEWTFDDGTTVAQSLVETRTMQTLDIEPVVTSTVTLRLVSVSSPGAGRSARDYTAISDLALVGSPAGGIVE